MFCPHCGSELPDGAAFCGHCGKPVGVQAPSTPSAQQAPTGAPAPAPMNVPPATPPDFNQPSPFDGAKPKKGFHITRGMTIGIVAVVAVIAVVGIVLAVTNLFGGGGHGSAQDIAHGVQAFYEPLLTGEADSDQAESLAGDLLDLMHPEVVNAIMEQSGMDRDEVAESLGDSLGSFASYYSSAISSLEDTISVSVEVSVGDELEEYDIESINETFADEGVDVTVTDGYFLEGSITVTFKEDYLDYSAGDEETEDLGSLGLCAVKIDGSWYLWGGVY